MNQDVELIEAIEEEVSKELSAVISVPGLELTEAEQIKQSYLPFFVELSEVKEASKKINFDNPTELDEKIARELRLKTVKIRTRSEELKEGRKKIHMLKANVEQSAWNLIRDTCKLEEEHFTAVEKRREMIEKARQEALRIERSNELQPYAEFVPVGIDLGRMSDEDYAKFLNGAKLQYDAKQEAIRKAELERIERERIQTLHNERKNLLISEWQYVPDEYKDDNFGLYTDGQWEQINHLTSKAKSAFQKEQERIRIENERLRKEAEEAAKAKEEAEAKAKAEREAAEMKLAKERAKAEAERKAAEEKARKEREAAEAKLKAEREEKERLEAELKARQLAEEKAKKEKALAEKKALAAPDKEKLIKWAATLRPQCEPLKTDEAETIYKEAIRKLNLVVDYIRTEADKL